MKVNDIEIKLGVAGACREEEMVAWLAEALVKGIVAGLQWSLVSSGKDFDAISSSTSNSVLLLCLPLS